MRFKANSLLLILGLIGLSTSGVWACSVCRCGDNDFLFTEKAIETPVQGANRHFGLSIGNLYSAKSNMLAGDEGVGTERQRELRPSFRLAYKLTGRLSFAFEMPFQFRRIQTFTQGFSSKERSSGIGDAELSAVWMHNIVSSNEHAIAGGLSFTIKAPTGQNNIQRAGQRLDEHLQAGTGALDWQFGLALSRITCGNQIFTSVYYRHNGKNDFDYHYGNAMLYNIGAQRPLNSWLIGSVQINGRFANRDADHSLIIGNTGGWVTYITPGLRLNLTQTSGLFAAVQIPTFQKLYGTQSESAVLNTGLTFEF